MSGSVCPTGQPGQNYHRKREVFERTAEVGEAHHSAAKALEVARVAAERREWGWSGTKSAKVTKNTRSSLKLSKENRFEILVL